MLSTLKYIFDFARILYFRKLLGLRTERIKTLEY